jgi:hypothetical protein
MTDAPLGYLRRRRAVEQNHLKNKKKIVFLKEWCEKFLFGVRNDGNGRSMKNRLELGIESLTNK